MKRRSPSPGNSDAAGYDLVEPRASALSESLRAFGYSLRAAVADLVDNSISAGARNVWLTAFWSGANSYLALTDDGCGMSRADLVNAMRPGSKSPVEERKPNDLGRFGLGLKTASFSQCRRLTVWSRCNGGRAATRCWDLDYISQTEEWRLLSKIDEKSRDRLQSLALPAHGTVVLWENLDRVVGNASTDDADAKAHFHDQIDEVQDHMGMVFHRFLSRPSRLSLFVNGDDDEHRLRPWDPFLTEHRATQTLQQESLRVSNGVVRIEPFVLPHHDKLTKPEHKAAGGPAGWNAQQGFYVYRNDRLLVSGSWLGLGYSKEEHYKLARIAVDFPSSLDQEWQIDVKKSVARPPRQVRKRLKQLAEITRKRAVEVYRHRDALQPRTGPGETILIWRAATRGDKTVYQIQRDHPLIRACLAGRPELARTLNALLQFIEETVPIHHIWLDSVQNSAAAPRPFEALPDQTVLPILKSTYRSLRQHDHTPEQAREKLARFDGLTPFVGLIKKINDDNCGD